MSVGLLRTGKQGCFLVHSGALLLTVDSLALLLTVRASLLTVLASTYSWSFCAYSGKVRPIRALRDGKAKKLNCKQKAPTVSKKASPRRIQSIYLHRSGPLLENGLDRPRNCYGRYGFASFYNISISTVGVDGARDSL